MYDLLITLNRSILTFAAHSLLFIRCSPIADLGAVRVPRLSISPLGILDGTQFYSVVQSLVGSAYVVSFKLASILVNNRT